MSLKFSSRKMHIQHILHDQQQGKYGRGDVILRRGGSNINAAEWHEMNMYEYKYI